MSLLKIANILRTIGAGFFLVGIYYRMLPLWIFGLVVMIGGSVWRIFIKVNESKQEGKQ